MKMIEVVLSCIGERVVIPKVRRDIVPFEQLRFDYGDKNAQALFDDISQLNDFWVKNFKLVLSVLTSTQFKTYKRSAILLNLILRVKTIKNIVSFLLFLGFS